AALRPPVAPRARPATGHLVRLGGGNRAARAHAIPSGSRPVANVPSTMRVRASITEIRSAAVLATNTRRPSGEIAIPTGVEPTARLATRRRVPVSNTLTRLLPEFDTHARRPSGVKRIRIGSPALAITA